MRCGPFRKHSEFRLPEGGRRNDAESSRSGAKSLASGRGYPFAQAAQADNGALFAARELAARKRKLELAVNRGGRRAEGFEEFVQRFHDLALTLLPSIGHRLSNAKKRWPPSLTPSLGENARDSRQAGGG